MSEDRYRQLQDAIDTTRYSMTAGGEPGPDWIGEVRHLDTLARSLKIANEYDAGGYGPKFSEPIRDCVERALREMGALNE